MRYGIIGSQNWGIWGACRSGGCAFGRVPCVACGIYGALGDLEYPAGCEVHLGCRVQRGIRGAMWEMRLCEMGDGDAG